MKNPNPIIHRKYDRFKDLLLFHFLPSPAATNRTKRWFTNEQEKNIHAKFFHISCSIHNSYNNNASKQTSISSSEIMFENFQLKNAKNNNNEKQQKSELFTYSIELEAQAATAAAEKDIGKSVLHMKSI